MRKTPEVVLSGYDYKISRLRAVSDESNRLSMLYKKRAVLGVSEDFAECVERQISENYHRMESLAGDMTIYEKNSIK